MSQTADTLGAHTNAAGNLRRQLNLAREKLKPKGNISALQCTLEFRRRRL